MLICLETNDLEDLSNHKQEWFTVPDKRARSVYKVESGCTLTEQAWHWIKGHTRKEAKDCDMRRVVSLVSLTVCPRKDY